MARYQTGDIVEGIVTGIESYGIFIKIDENSSGLIHISEISSYFVKNIEDYVKVGENILCEVLECESKSNHLKLSIKNINYKLTPKYGKIKDTKNGFKPLQMKLPIWIREKMEDQKR